MRGSSGLATRFGLRLAPSQRGRKANRGRGVLLAPDKGRGMTAPLRATGSASGRVIRCPIYGVRISVAGLMPPLSRGL